MEGLHRFQIMGVRKKDEGKIYGFAYLPVWTGAGTMTCSDLQVREPCFSDEKDLSDERRPWFLLWRV
jgi:hypothetical protein